MSKGKIKGTIMIEVVKFLRTHKEQARTEVPPHLQHYLSSRILSTSWFPEEDYLALMGVVVRLRPRTDEDKGLTPWEAAARVSSMAFFEGPYKALVRKGDPGRTLSNLTALWRLRHDSGEFKVDLLGPNEARLELRDYALGAGEPCSLVQGTLWGFLYYSDAKNPKVEHQLCRARGDATCEWRATWS
jgi:hypothetical protein